ncbi:MAG: GTP-dependent dephospho-CoA kinase family protein [Candidatus Micrarchaeota archaeon]
MPNRKITERIRTILKKPIGDLLQPAQLFDRLLEKSKGLAKPIFRGNHYDSSAKKQPLIISVGDITTLKLLENGIIPDVSFFDYICKREAIEKGQKEKLAGFKAKKIMVKNAPGMVSAQLWAACKEAFSPNSKFPIKVIVDGEEDLAVLCAIIHSPTGSVIIYGQPEEGAVLVIVDGRQKRRARKFYEESIEIN